MGFVNRWKGKHVNVSFENPEPLGECDQSGFTFNHKDLHKQMAWRGDRLVWTGFMVGTPYLDEPNQQSRPPLVKSDPTVVLNARPPEGYISPDIDTSLTATERLASLEQNGFYSNNSNDLSIDNTNFNTQQILHDLNEVKFNG
jgi:hypothetical protein